MTRQIYDVNNYPRSKVGDPLTPHWTVRKLLINGEHRDVIVRKKNGKKQLARLEDKRMSKQISFTEARKIHRKRSKKSRMMDDRTTHKKVKHFADESWAKNPRRYDVSGIDTKKRK